LHPPQLFPSSCSFRCGALIIKGAGCSTGLLTIAMSTANAIVQA